MTHTSVANIEAADDLAHGLFDPTRERSWQAVTSRFASADADIAARLLGGPAGAEASAL